MQLGQRRAAVGIPLVHGSASLEEEPRARDAAVRTGVVEGASAADEADRGLGRQQQLRRLRVVVAAGEMQRRPALAVEVIIDYDAQHVIGRQERAHVLRPAVTRVTEELGRVGAQH